MTHIDGAICQLVTLVSLVMIGRAGVIAEQCGDNGGSCYRKRGDWEAVTGGGETGEL